MSTAFRVVLVVWLAIGVGVCGALHIFAEPTKEWSLRGTITRTDEERFEDRNIAILVTVVGTILIGGLGLSLGKGKGDVT